MRRCGLVWFVMLVAVALPPVASADSFDQELALARRLFMEAQYWQALVAYEKAVAIKPEHAAALGELGYARYQYGQLDAAERDTRQALHLAKTKRRKAALRYNLSVIALRRGDRQGAVRELKASIALAGSATKKRRLTALEKAAGTPVQRPTTQLKGPYASLAALCTEVELSECPKAKIGEQILLDHDLNGIYQRMVYLRPPDDGGQGKVMLALQTPEGWFGAVTPLKHHGRFSRSLLSAVTHKDEPGELEIRVRQAESRADEPTVIDFQVVLCAPTQLGGAHACAFFLENGSPTIKRAKGARLDGRHVLRVGQGRALILDRKRAEVVTLKR